jgi:hypothetical protein
VDVPWDPKIRFQRLKVLAKRERFVILSQRDVEKRKNLVLSLVDQDQDPCQEEVANNTARNDGALMK